MTTAKSKPLTNVMAPKPVHPKAVRTHGLFGIPFVRQHMMVDDYWTPSSLTEQFKGMADLLEKRRIFQSYEYYANRTSDERLNRKLRRQCRDGRHILQMRMYGENTKKIRNLLIHHKDMQRLYQKMPIHMVVDNINQRSFVMRKERDRLRYRLNQLKDLYESKLLERATLENRIKYENEFVLEEEIKSREFRKKIENSNVRLKAIKTINTTYSKMIQILRHDGIFYEPIIRSLSADIEDQGNFIKHILYLGMPAIAKFKELNEEYRTIEDKARKSFHSKSQMTAAYKKNAPRYSWYTQKNYCAIDEKPSKQIIRYVRETDSMQLLKSDLEAVETIIKQIKFATLCSQAKEIYPRIKSQVENNEILHKMIERDVLKYKYLESKEDRDILLHSALIHNLTTEEVDRKARIKFLQEGLEKEDKLEATYIDFMKNRCDAYVLLRFTLWNLHDILRHVAREPKRIRKYYPNSYLKLPLLKFEMLPMHSIAPEIYEENIDSLMQILKDKVSKLVKVYDSHIRPEDLRRFKAEYHELFLESLEEEYVNAADAGPEPSQHVDEETEEIDDPTKQRKMLKDLSAKIVEEHSKKED